MNMIIKIDISRITAEIVKMRNDLLKFFQFNNKKHKLRAIDFISWKPNESDNLVLLPKRPFTIFFLKNSIKFDISF